MRDTIPPMPASYRERPPAGDLRPWVRCVWSGTSAPADAPGEVLPDGCCDVIWRPGSAPFVAGPDTAARPATRPWAPRIVGLRFRPGSAPGPLGTNLRLLRDRRVELAALWGAARARELGERLEESADPDAAIALLEAALRARLAGTRPPDAAVVAHARSLEQDLPRETALPVRERQLRRRFVAAVGYGPRTFRRIARLQRFLALAARPRRPGLSDLAATCGYADQAHLTRECRRLTGRTPAALLATR